MADSSSWWCLRRRVLTEWAHSLTKPLQQHRWFCSSVRGNTQDQLQGCENTSCQFHQDAGSPPRPGLKYTRTQHPETNTRSICRSGTLTFVIKFYISSSLTVCRTVLTQVGFSWNSAVMLLDRCGPMWTDVDRCGPMCPVPSDLGTGIVSKMSRRVRVT